MIYRFTEFYKVNLFCNLKLIFFAVSFVSFFPLRQLICFKLNHMPSTGYNTVQHYISFLVANNKILNDKSGAPTAHKMSMILNLQCQCMQSSNCNTVLQHMYLPTLHYRPHCCVYKRDDQKDWFLVFFIFTLEIHCSS